MDSDDKRLSIIAMGRPFTPTLPTPDGSVSEQDRKHFAYIYRGDEDVVVVAAAAVVPRDIAWVWRDRRRHGAPGHHTTPLTWRWR